MRTINLQTAYQLVITALLLGACLGLLSQRLPESLRISSPLGVIYAEPAFPNAPSLATSVAADQPAADTTTSKTQSADVQVEVEVHTRGNANAAAHAVGPANSDVKASTEGEGDGRSVAYINAPIAPEWQQSTQSIAPAAAPQGVGRSEASSPTATVNEDFVNLRSAPSLDASIVGSATRGQQFAVVGRDPTNSWLQVCCVNGQTVWIYREVVLMVGVSAYVAVVQSAPVVSNNSPRAAVASPTVAPPTATPAPVPQYAFALSEKTQFGEGVTPRIYAFVHQDDELLGGYRLRVRKDGAELAAPAVSTSGAPNYTWPIPHPRQRSYNLKVEFPRVNVAGIWEITLFDPGGAEVGTPAIFSLAPNDPNQELYVNYVKK